MSGFSKLNIKKIVRPFEGDKISIETLISQPITIIDFAIEASKKKEGTEFMKMQIVHNGKKEFVLTGSVYLIDIMKQITKNDLPLENVVILKNRGYYFEGTIDC